MYPPMHVDETRDAEGGIVKPGQDYYLKPMNCPMHCLIYRSRTRSYRELPLRMFEFGSVYRYEKSGVVHGLARVRGMTQDDAHIFTAGRAAGRRDPVAAQVRARPAARLRAGRLLPRAVDEGPGQVDRHGRRVGARRRRILAEAADACGLDLVLDPGGAAFYGPKISVQARDAIGRTWQISTIQVDLTEPQRFGLEFTAADGSRQRPVMIHRALFGSIERFLGVLTEHYAGAFPPWLAPVQVVAVPVADAFVPYLKDVADPPSEQGDSGRGRRIGRPDAEEDPHGGQAEGAVRAHRRCRRRGRGCGELPLPRRAPGQRRSAGPGGRGDRPPSPSVDRSESAG